MRGLDGDFVLREFFAAAQRGGGWVDYEVVNPVTGAVDEKTSYILPLGSERVIGCGVFKPKGASACRPEIVRDRSGQGTGIVQPGHARELAHRRVVCRVLRPGRLVLRQVQRLGTPLCG